MKSVGGRQWGLEHRRTVGQIPAPPRPALPRWPWRVLWAVSGKPKAVFNVDTAGGRRVAKSLMSSYPVMQWGAGSTPDARPDPVTVTVQLPAEA